MEMEQQIVCCPKCAEPLSLEVKAKLFNESRVSWTLHPKAGEKLSARTVGDTISHVEKLLVSIGKDLGAKTVVLVEGIENDRETGVIRVDFLITRVGPGVERKPATPSVPDQGETSR